MLDIKSRDPDDLILREKARAKYLPESWRPEFATDGLVSMREQLGTFIADAKSRAEKTTDLRVKNGVRDLCKIAEDQAAKLALLQKDFAKLIGNSLKTGNLTPLSTAYDNEQWQKKVNGQVPKGLLPIIDPKKTFSYQNDSILFWELAVRVDRNITELGDRLHELETGIDRRKLPSQELHGAAPKEAPKRKFLGMSL